MSLKVKIFVLPAADDVESMWTTKFGFTKITSDEVSSYAATFAFLWKN